MKRHLFVISMISYCSLAALSMQDIETFFKPLTDAANTVVSHLESQSTTAAQALTTSLEQGRDWFIKTGQDAQTAVVTFFDDPLKELIQKNLPAYANNPYKTTGATVRTGNALCSGEHKALINRLERIQRNMSKQYNKTVTRPPKIALITSGGGYRAMIYTLGFLTGIQKTGLLDDITWVSSLSGSTWAVGTLLAHAQQAPHTPVSIAAFQQNLYKRIAGKDIRDVTNVEAQLIADELLTRMVAGQAITLVDIYGALLANRLLADFGLLRHRVYLSQQAPLVESGAWPIPIYTAIRADNNLSIQQLSWYEFTPWEVGSTWLNSYVPVWAFGRVYNNGVSTDFDPEKSLGFAFGTFGSAFAATIEDIYASLAPKIESPAVREVLEATIVRHVGKSRLTWAQVDNFTRNIAASPLRSDSSLRMADAGLAFNLPYPPVSGERPDRTPDILIFVDASYTVQGSPELKKVEEYARRIGLPFPTIDYNKSDKNGVSIFKDPSNPKAPIVIYQPRINDKAWWPGLAQPALEPLAPYIEGFNVESCVLNSFCDTFNFTYSLEAMTRLAALGEFNAHMATPLIMEQIRQLIEKTATP